MSTQSLDTVFLQNNLLPEDGWDFHLGDETSSSGKGFSSSNNFLSDSLCLNNDGDFLSFTPSSTTGESIDALLEDVLCDGLLQESSGPDSAATSPSEQFSDHGSCSSSEFLDRTDATHTNSEFCADLPICLEEIANSGTQEHTASSNDCGLNLCEPVNDEKTLKATELEIAIKRACEETNRLLQLHKQIAGTERCTNSEQKRSPCLDNQHDALSSICESTIFDSSDSGVITKTSVTVKKPRKRKSSTLQDAIDRLQSANKNMCFRSTEASLSPVTLYQDLTQNNTSKVSSKTSEQSRSEPCILVTSVQQPVSVQPNNIILNANQTYSLGRSITTNQPVLYVKREPVATHSRQVVSNIIQSGALPNILPVNGQEILVSSVTSPQVVTISDPVATLIKPEQIMCNNGQTTLIQSPSATVQPLMKPFNISDLKPGPGPMVLSQSDVTRLTSQGVIKFPTKTSERNIRPVSHESVSPLALNSTNNHVIVSSTSNVISNPVAGLLKGTNILVNGTDNLTQHGQLDVKALKRHQRMIKNRASACESRQRRKEYIKTLEDQVNEVANENRLLHEKNDFLMTRIQELEIENKNLRDSFGVKRSYQNKTACMFMLMVFVGLNIFQRGLFQNGPFMDSSPYENGTMYALPSVPQRSFRSGRQLLAIDDQIDLRKEFWMQENSNNKNLIISQKESFWMDDLVKRYKDKHLENFLQLLSETTSSSMKRLLRRKLKEELGINIPLPVPRSRRISYSPQTTRKRVNRKLSTLGLSDNAMTSLSPATSSKSKVVMPPSMPPCSHSASQGFNETESSRVNDDLEQWARRYTEVKVEKSKRAAKKKKNTKSPSSRYEEPESSNTSIAIYTRPNKKYHNFFEAIDRRNDTFYVVSLNREHLLLPAISHNISSRMKMALVMPAITTKDRLNHPSDEYETMIHIECEVLNTRMYDMKLKDVPDYLEIKPPNAAIKALDNVSNDTIRNIPKSTNNHQTSHGSSSGEKVSTGHDGDAQKPGEEQDAVVSDVLEYDVLSPPVN